MPLRKARGNMYPWVTHTHSHLGGECPHRCSYCYVDNPRFGRPAVCQRPLRLIEKELKVRYGEGRTIFVEHRNDLFAAVVPLNWIARIMGHCSEWPHNEYVFQTKNPERYIEVLRWLPALSMLGCTIETNREIARSISLAPRPIGRMAAMGQIKGLHPLFVTVEPIMDFDVDVLMEWLIEIGPEFVNIGADSKGHGLPEPEAGKVQALIVGLRLAGIEVREKRNLERIVGLR